MRWCCPSKAADDLGVRAGDALDAGRADAARSRRCRGDGDVQPHPGDLDVAGRLADAAALRPAAAPWDGAHRRDRARPAPPPGRPTLAAADQAARHEDRRPPTTRCAAIGSYTAENGSLQLMRGFLFAISALVIGAFFTVWTIQRSGDVAVLKALGASTALLLRDALGQAVVLLAAGTAPGHRAGRRRWAPRSAARVPFVLDPPTVLVPALIMIALGAAGAALSIRRITSVDPLTALGSAR